MGVKAWITVNGVHIPIMDGESKMQAVNRFIQGNRNKEKKIVTNKIAKTIDKKYREINKRNIENAANRLLKNNRPTIKGRAKTPSKAAVNAKAAYEKAMKEYNEAEDALAKAQNSSDKQSLSKLYSRYNKVDRALNTNKVQKYFDYQDQFKTYKLKEDKPSRKYSTSDLVRMSENKLKTAYKTANSEDQKYIKSEMGSRGLKYVNGKWVNVNSRRNYNRYHKTDPYD